MWDLSWRVVQAFCAFFGRLAGPGVFVLGALNGCAPDFNWREIRGQQPEIMASFPCKPDHHSRQVTLEGMNGLRLPMALKVCEVGEHTFAMTEVDVQDPARIPIVMKNLLLAYTRNVAAQADAGVRQEWVVKGMTPQPAGGRWSFAGTLPSGKASQLETGLVSRGTVIVQVSVSGPELAPEVVKQFFEGLILLEGR